MLKKEDRKTEIPFKLSAAKDNYIIIGDNTPHDMIFPVVVDITDLQKLFNDFLQIYFPRKNIHLKIDTENAVIEIKEE